MSGNEAHMAGAAAALSAAGYNPNLLNPQNSQAVSIPPTAAYTPAYPLVLIKEAISYICTMVNHHMHRKDGKKLAFVPVLSTEGNVGHLRTQDAYDVEYLNEEIAKGNPFLRTATPGEVQAYLMKIDPKGTITKELTPGIEEQVRKDLSDKLDQLGIQLTPEQRTALMAKRQEEKSQEDLTQQQTAVAGDEKKLASTTTRQDAVSRLLGVKAAGATVQMSRSPELQGIVGSDKTPNAVDSTSPAPKS